MICSPFILAVVLGQGLNAPAKAEVLEIPRPGSGRQILQAHFRVPYPLGRREAAAWKTLAALLKDGTLDFTPSQMVEQTGASPRFFLSQTSLCIHLEGIKGSLPAQVQIIDSLMRRPLFNSDLIRLKAKTLEKGPSDSWSRALQSESYEWSELRADHVLELQGQIIRPENLTLVVAGDFEPGSASAETAPLDVLMPRPSRRSSLRFDPPPVFAAPGGEGIRAVSFRSRLEVKTVDQAATALTLSSALTMGKGSSLYRLVREKEGEAYALSGFIEPSPGGWNLRALALQTSGRKLSAERMKALLLEDSKAWTEDHLKRARAMALTGLTMETFDSLLSVGSERIMPGLETEAFLMGVSRGGIRLEALEAAIEQVTLKNLQALASEALQRAEGAESKP